MFRVDSVYSTGIMVARVGRRWDDDTQFLLRVNLGVCILAFMIFFAILTIDTRFSSRVVAITAGTS